MTSNPHEKDRKTALSPAPSVFASEIDGFTAASRLSRRESDIVLALVRNVTNSEEIASALGISTHTVNNHLKSIFEKTATKSKTEILASFLRFAAQRMQNRSLFIRKPRILIIDDETVVCDYMANGLADRGMRTYRLTDSSQAIQAISSLKIDVVVCDIRMPGLDGMSLLKEVRKLHRCLPHVVFCTGYPDYTIEECMHHGAAGYIEKPLDIEKLFRMIMEFLVESDDEKADLLQIKTVQPVVLDELYRVSSDELGFGGAFLAMDLNAQKRVRLSVGSVVDMKLCPEDCPQTLHVRGQVVWKRTSDETSRPAGVGVKFLNMSDQDQYIFDNYVRDKEISAFIPMGVHKEAG